MGLSLILALALGGGDADEVRVGPAVDADGAKVHVVASPFQAGKTEIRVLLPSVLKPGVRYPVIYLLPVEAGRESRFGDGLAEAKKRGLADKHQAIFVAPTFSHLPWYADHPSRREIRQETYFRRVVVPFVERTYPVRPGAGGRFLLGFSKSGWGAFSLLLRHPGEFAKAYAWDAPLTMTAPNRYGMGDIFGTQVNFERYRITTLLATQAKTFATGPPRLFHAGYGNFRSHHADVEQAMTALGVVRGYVDGPSLAHDWHSGWVEPGVAALLKE